MPTKKVDHTRPVPFDLEELAAGIDGLTAWVLEVEGTGILGLMLCPEGEVDGEVARYQATLDRHGPHAPGPALIATSASRAAVRSLASLKRGRCQRLNQRGACVDWFSA